MATTQRGQSAITMIGQPAVTVATKAVSKLVLIVFEFVTTIMFVEYGCGDHDVVEYRRRRTTVEVVTSDIESPVITGTA